MRTKLNFWFVLLLFNLVLLGFSTYAHGGNPFGDYVGAKALVSCFYLGALSWLHDKEARFYEIALFAFVFVMFPQYVLIECCYQVWDKAAFSALIMVIMWLLVWLRVFYTFRDEERQEAEEQGSILDKQE